ncbi:MAG: hypothetical protein COB53_03745 [Elusimicrobia bacterium]|nr:MAG: hypothetical protein COB53_03745 [Elusimicrobiota bacterium]
MKLFWALFLFSTVAFAEEEFDSVAWSEALTYKQAEWSADDFGKKASRSDRELLNRYKPRVYLAPGQIPPVDFYRYYLPKTVVRNGKENDSVVMHAPDRTQLKSIERRLDLYLDYQGPDSPCGQECRDYKTVAYGRVYQESMVLPGSERPVPVAVLKYSFVFLYSGLPSKTGWLRELGAGLIGDRERWHELDIHGAIHVVLGPKKKPVALLLAQHNHFRSWVFGQDIPLPKDSRAQVCFASRSNEPYLCPHGDVPEYHNTTGDPAKIEWLLLGRNRPVASGQDGVWGPLGGATELAYDVEFPMTRDPLYVSWMPLGARGKILWWDSWEKTGPPGIDMNTWPELQKYSDIAQFWYVRDGSVEDAELMGRHLKSFFNVEIAPVLKNNGKRFAAALRAAGHLP